ncbi:MAG: MFS transporter [Isosphaeraceae bacterium]
MSTGEDAPPRWYSGVGREQWVVLAASSAGWVFDVYEGQLFTIFKTPMLRDLTGGAGAAEVDWHANVAFAVFLVGGAVGGLGFGMLADRLGRVRVMSWTILVYSVFSALTYFARNPLEVDVLRFLVALGTGGEWAVAAALVAETFPTRARAFASGTFHASSVLGAALASLTGIYLVGPGAWRYGFLLGLAPALLTLWIRWGLKEPEGWRQSHAAGSEPAGSLRELLGDPRWRGRAWLGLALASVGLATYWGIFAWGPELAGEVLGPDVSPAERQSSSSFAYLIMNFTGGLLGLLAFAPLAQSLGRRGAFVVYHLGAAAAAPAAFLLSRSYTDALILLPVMAFFVVGMHAGYAVYLPELFPTRLRASGSSFCFNVGRVVGASVLLVRGALGASLGMRYGVVVLSGLFLVGLAVLAFVPETRGRELAD